MHYSFKYKIEFYVKLICITKIIIYFYIYGIIKQILYSKLAYYVLLKLSNLKNSLIVGLWGRGGYPGNFHLPKVLFWSWDGGRVEE